jgi:iron-sulfur cluster repair protein YtfE (RIC family)
MTTLRTEGRDAVRSFAEHEHEELCLGIERLHEIREGLASVPVDQRMAGVRKVLIWIDTVLRPHMAWEESWLFPQIDQRARTPWATRLVRSDHRQIEAKAEGLRALCARGGSLPTGLTMTVVAELAGLEALIRANVEHEERVLLPLLSREVDRWTPELRD